MTTTTRDPLAIAQTYLATWNEADDGRRRERLGADWASGATYLDPLMRGEGRDGIAHMIGAARERFPGYSFALKGQPDGHGDLVRFSWVLAAADGAIAGGGTDVVRLDGERRIAEVLGFLDGVPA